MRPLTQCTALLFDGSSTDALSRLFVGATRVWCVRGDEINARELLRSALDEIDKRCRNGAHVVLSQSFEAFSAFSVADGLQLNAKPTDAPWLQALEFNAPRLLNRTQALAWLAQQSVGTTTHLTPATPALSEAQFIEHIEAIRALIVAGDTYQVNYTFPLHGELLAYTPSAQNDAALAAVYHQLVQDLKIPYGAFLTLPHNSLLSFSPELFVEMSSSALTCRPMKGTAAVSNNDIENTQRAATLAADPKNRAENLMIVDLMRNDLSRLQEVDKVSVPKLFEVKRYGAVLQMTSTVKAHLTRQPTLFELFDAIFPCGSITGAPKRRTIEIIHALEADARDAYCGALGFIEPAAQLGSINATFSVPIRTVQTSAEPNVDALNVAHWPLRLSVGAGITFDSIATDEWQESLLKAKFLTAHTQPFELIETMRVAHDGSIALLKAHESRLQRSARALGWTAPDALLFKQAVDDAVAAFVTMQPNRVGRLRLTLSANGTFSTQVNALDEVHEPVFFSFNPHPTQSGNPFLQHKTSVRQTYNTALQTAKHAGLFDSIFVNERGEVTEGARSSIFILREGVWHTPPLSCGVLTGVQRGELLAKLNAQESVLYVDDVRNAEQIILCNALYGALTAVLK